MVDECARPGLARWLRENGHDVFSVFDQAQGMTDDNVLQLALDEERILITNFFPLEASPFQWPGRKAGLLSFFRTNVL